MYTECVRSVLHSYESILQLSPEQFCQVGSTIAIPQFSQQTIIDLCAKATEILLGKQSLIEISSPIYIVGDLHGNLYDLLRIFIFAKTPPRTRFLFLGDYVDRGQFSVEIVTLLFAMHCAFPEHIFLLRGNHEFEHVNQNYGFQSECQELWGNLDIWHAINEVFTYLPLTAVINNQIFCVHGGLSPQITSIKYLQRIKLPIIQYEKDDIVCDLVWSDPSSDTPDYLRSNRGSGVTFGTTSIAEFFRVTKMKHIVRAHQCVQLGVEKFSGDDCYTVFSCSNYVDANGNRCGLLFVSPESEIKSFSLPPSAIRDRKSTLFTSGDSVRHQISLAMNLKLADIGLKTSRASTNMLSPPARRGGISSIVSSGAGITVNGVGVAGNAKLRSVSMDCLVMHPSLQQRRRGGSSLPRLQQI